MITTVTLHTTYCAIPCKLTCDVGGLTTLDRRWDEFRVIEVLEVEIGGVQFVPGEESHANTHWARVAEDALDCEDNQQAACEAMQSACRDAEIERRMAARA